MDRSIKYICFSLSGIFALLVAEIFAPPIRLIFKGPIFLLPFFVFSILGITLIVKTKKAGIQGAIRKKLLITGFSSTGIFIFVLLHNFFYGITTFFQVPPALKFILGALNAISFICALIVCPVVFLVAIFLVFKNK